MRRKLVRRTSSFPLFFSSEECWRTQKLVPSFFSPILKKVVALPWILFPSVNGLLELLREASRNRLFEARVALLVPLAHLPHIGSLLALFFLPSIPYSSLSTPIYQSPQGGGRENLPGAVLSPLLPEMYNIRERKNIL